MVKMTPTLISRKIWIGKKFNEFSHCVLSNWNYFLTLVAQKKSCVVGSNTSGLFWGEGEKINAFLPSAFLPPPIHFSILAERSISAYNCVSKAKMPGVSKTNIQFNPFLSTATRAPWPFALRALLFFFGL